MDIDYDGHNPDSASLRTVLSSRLAASGRSTLKDDRTELSLYVPGRTNTFGSRQTESPRQMFPPDIHDSSTRVDDASAHQTDENHEIKQSADTIAAEAREMHAWYGGATAAKFLLAGGVAGAGP